MYKAVSYLTILCVSTALIHETVALVSRTQWGARASKFSRKFSRVSQYVVIHHSVSPGPCTTSAACKTAMKSMQNSHMDTNGWSDIGYSFAVGGDGEIYEGRGYNVVGAHAPGYNSKSIGLLFIGNYRSVAPTTKMITAAKNFLVQAVSQGKLASNYKLIGHRQAVSTECPGDKLYNEIKKWPQYVAKP